MNPAREILLQLFAQIPEGELTLAEGGKRTVFGSGTPRASVTITSPRAWQRLLHGSRGLADGYAEGLWDAEDLSAVIRLAARNAHVLDRWRRRLGPARILFEAVRGMRGKNTRERSRRDIAAHYDLGNELFEAMLDETMTYSCAYFPSASATLAEASRAKLELACSKLEIGPRDHVLEIGTGWGSFAIHAASTRGCRVTTTTISRAQYDYAWERVERAGVGDLVTVLCDDYRDLNGRYDKLVSIEMIEAVGWRNFGTFFESCSRLLTHSGAMLLQAIVVDDPAYEIQKSTPSFIRSYIFPHGCLPSVEVITRCLAQRTDMRLAGLEELTPHYVETLRRWRARFDASSERLARLGYDERFRRLWRLYLAYCEAGFAEGRIRDLQALLAKPRWRPSTPLDGRAVRRQAGAERPSHAAAEAAASAASDGHPIVVTP